MVAAAAAVHSVVGVGEECSGTPCTAALDSAPMRSSKLRVTAFNWEVNDKRTSCTSDCRSGEKESPTAVGRNGTAPWGATPPYRSVLRPPAPPPPPPPLCASVGKTDGCTAAGSEDGSGACKRGVDAVRVRREVLARRSRANATASNSTRLR